ncbi:hypothetical protein [Geminicoccus flavidas]|uniref:hypothetical protein n=1 Tax=Geminicoccus flavidas TaxID=2506407 RepID=UPI001357A6FE|nr:hypothetical protein [Geminicoccus flavidas]
MTTEELHQYRKEVLAKIEPDPRWAEMTPEQLHDEARRLVQERQQQAALFN